MVAAQTQGIREGLVVHRRCRVGAWAKGTHLAAEQAQVPLHRPTTDLQCCKDIFSVCSCRGWARQLAEEIVEREEKRHREKGERREEGLGDGVGRKTPSCQLF